MKLPGIVGYLFQKKTEKKETFLSLLLDADAVQAAAWHIDKNGTPYILATATQAVQVDSWDERLIACDHAITKLDGKVNVEEIQKVVLGLTVPYVTETGDIDTSVRPQIKKLTKSLGLIPLGFVPVHQAILYKLKKDEGVPSTVILIGVTHFSLIVHLAKVGSLISQKIITRQNHITQDLEKVLNHFPDTEVLPSRMLLYGFDQERLEDVKRELLGYPWPTKVNFIHYPKIECLPLDTSIIAVSRAGASELAKTLGDEDMLQDQEVVTSQEELSDEYSKQTAKPVAVAEREAVSAVSEETDEDYKYREVQEKEIIDVGTVKDESGVRESEVQESDVVMVEPEELGFQKNVDILEEIKSKPDISGLDHKKDSLKAEEIEEADQKREKRREWLRTLTGMFSHVKQVGNVSKVIGERIVSRSSAIVAIGAFIALSSIVGGLLYWNLPRISVTLIQIPKVLNETVTVEINAKATTLDPEKKIIPARTAEKSQTGEKTIEVTGKKEVGDPAKGAITIYNKSLSAKVLKKGTVLSVGSLNFTLDEDVSIASASESIGSITFGKAIGAIVASAIGVQSNLPAGSEFNIKDFATSVMAARNEQPLSGGSSKFVTVVTRKDYNTLVAAVSDDLIAKTKEEFEKSVEGSEKLIDATIKTEVTEKSFVEELDQEAQQLHGKVTVTVSGLTYSEEDLGTIAKSLLESNISSGYNLDASRTEISLGEIKVKKDGRLISEVKIKGYALPAIESDTIRKTLAGKKIQDVENYLKQLTGIGGVEFVFHRWPWKDRLPGNANNISILTTVQE